MTRKTYYHYVCHDGEISRPYTDMESVQVDISAMGAPHHVIEVVSITYKFHAGQIEGIEYQNTHPVWWKQWRDLENAKRILQSRENRGATP